MKHSELHTFESQKSFLHTAVLVCTWVLPLLMIVPNIALDITESYSWADKATNILLPLAAYMAVCASFRRAGLAGLLLLPFMVLCAFQIVLLFLYGKSIIAVDMFLNVVTTNMSEATELLKNLGAAICTVIAIYLPPLIISIAAFSKGIILDRPSRRPVMLAAILPAVAGIVCGAFALRAESGTTLRHTLFPVNVCANIVEAVHRTTLTAQYFEKSDNFTFKAEANESREPEVYVLVIGETSRADNWQLNGYCRDTNPKLSQRTGLVSFKKVLSESNTTHKSVPLMLSHLECGSFGDSIYAVKGICEAFREAGFHTAWISNQQRNGALIDFFGDNADETIFLADDGNHHYDMELCHKLNDILSQHKDEKMFVVLHTYGSHFNYKERYPETYNHYLPDDATEASQANRQNLMNAYDNSIRYADTVLNSIIDTIDKNGVPSAMLYLADHGEDIFDDDRGRFLHASPTPTYWQLHVPMLAWMSDYYRYKHPDKYSTAVANTGKNVSSSRSAFHTLLSLAGISTPYFRRDAALCETAYHEPPRVYLNDYNRAVRLEQSGMEAEDFDMLAQRRISIR